ncbi:MAG TPA: hypothetical protein DCR55_03360 [Lentisphaeria bacterium]|jgi:hypothetical protein|nr:hypothetical protein [Lentisphaeria bacterium]
MGSFFSPDKAVVRVGHDHELLQLIRSVAGLADQALGGYQQLMGARAVMALAHVRSRAMSMRPVDRVTAQQV